MGSLNKKRKVVTWLVLVIMSFQMVFTTRNNILVKAEGANDRLSNYLKLAKGKTINDIDVSKITQEELRLLGVYLSNFYIPLSTELSSSHDDTSAKENMVTALVKGAYFDKTVAEALVEAIWEMTMQSATPLYIGAYTEGGYKGEITGDFGVYASDRAKGQIGSTLDGTLVADGMFRKEEGKGIEATYYSFIDMFAGTPDRHGKDSVLVNSGYVNKTLVLYWEDASGKKVPVFDTDFYNNDWKSEYNTGINFTPSSLTYGVLMDNINYSNGIGSSFLDCTVDEYNKLTSEAKELVTALDARLYVDCFGNILVDYGTAKYVLVPACVNPYAWYTDNDTSKVGRSINLVNLFMIDESINGHIDVDTTSEDYIYNFLVYDGDGSLFNLNRWRAQRGSDITELDNKLWGKGDYKALNDLAKDYCEPDGDDNYSFPEWRGYRHQLTSSDKKNYLCLTEDKRFGYGQRFGVIDDYIYFDSRGTFESAEDDDYSIFNLLNDGKGGIFHSDGAPLGGKSSSNFSSVVNSNELNIIQSGDALNYLTGIYVSYALAYYNDFSVDPETGKNTYTVNYAYAKDQFPSVSNIKINWENIEVSSDSMDKELKSMIYYFMHPTKGIEFVSKWFKNKVSGILVSWHEDMVGSSDGTSTTGSTKYLGFSGYVTLPTLSDIKWTAWLLDEYNNIVVYLIIIIFIVLISYCIVGSMTFQRAIFGTILFGVLAFFPPLCINATVNFINNTCDDIYGDKFTYWALVQHQTYISELDNAMQSEDKDSYLLALFKADSDSFNPNNYTRVKLKWLSPKKIDVTADVTSELNKLTESSLLSNIMNGTVRQQLSGETFLDTEDALYLYRDYADIYGYMIGGYHTETWYGNSSDVDARLEVTEQDLEADTTTQMYYNNSTTMYSIVGERSNLGKEFSQQSAIDKGFTINTGVSDTANKSYSFLLDSEVGSSLLSRNRLLLNNEISDDLALSVSNNFHYQRFGLGTDEFFVTLAKINQGVKQGRVDDSHDETVWVADPSKVFRKKDLGRFYFSLYTESPFYFFSWNILDQQTSEEFSGVLGNSADGLNSMLMDMYTINNQQYFYNYNQNALNGYGEMRDFCNMRALFYYVIPYLRSCNEGILTWSDLYGTFLYEDVSVKYTNGEAEFPDFSAKDSNGKPLYSDEYIYKWWHNYNVERLFNTYSPWVDLMYSCDYADSETITVLGEKYLVEDPLDPTSYFKMDSFGNITEGRLMVFSRTEMDYYGLTMKDLTVVEQKIIKVQDRVYEDLLQLMDYADFDNEVLVTSAGMITTFAFNQEFSQTSAFSDSYTLYPQSYELKAFSYDAYLRLILAESTGEDLMDSGNESGGSKSYYQRIVENSSITTGVALIILDIIAVYVIPAFKLFFLIAIFFMSVLMIIAAAIKLEMNIVKTTWESLVAPLLKFSAVSIGLAWIVSLFMSDGNTAITGRGGFTISLGDPTMVVLVMIVINVSAVILYYKICKKCFKQIVEFAKAVSTSMSGAIAGSLGKVTGLAIGGKQISDTIARGTAIGRGKSNQPVAKNPSLSSGDTTSSDGKSKGSSALGGFLAGTALGKASKERYDNVKLDVSGKQSMYDSKAKYLDNKLDYMENGSERKVNLIRSTTETLSGSYTDSASAVSLQREYLKDVSRNSNVLGKASCFVEDKKLAIKQGTYTALSRGTNAIGEVKSQVRKGFDTATSAIRNSKVGKFTKIDDDSRKNRLLARKGMLEQRKEELSQKDYRRLARAENRDKLDKLNPKSKNYVNKTEEAKKKAKEEAKAKAEAKAKPEAK